MLTQIQQNIQDTIKEIVHLERVEEQVKVTKLELKETVAEFEGLGKKLNKELRDIEKLERLSTKAIFYKVLGSKEKQLEKERQEYLELSLKEEDLSNSIDLLEYELNILEAKISSRTDLNNRLKKLKNEREEEIIKTDPALRMELLALSNNLEETYRFKIEVQEALEAGQLCHNLMQQIVSLLGRVKNWGQWPTHQANQHGRRRMRRDAIDRARNLAYQVKHHLNIFQNELKDIGKEITFRINPQELTEFSDFFFGNLITDWIMQQQLTRASQSANLLYRHLNNCVLELMAMKEASEKKITNINNRKDEILIR